MRGEYDWEAFKREYYYDENGDPPRDGDGNIVEFAPSEYLGFDPADIEGVLANAGGVGERADEVVDERTVNVTYEDEDAFFSTVEGHTTIANRYDLERAVPAEKKSHFREVNRYWVNKPYAFVIIFHSEKENEKKYYVVEPYLTPIESDLREFLAGKLKTAIKYSSDDVVIEGDDGDDGERDIRADVIERETNTLLDRYDLYEGGSRPGLGGDEGGTESGAARSRG